MDTRSRSIKYSYGLKVTALLIAMVCVFSSAWCCIDLTKILYDYGWENILVRENAVFTDTSLFQNEVAQALEDVHTANLSASWEQHAAEKFLSLEEEQARALEQFRDFKADVEQHVLKYYGVSADELSDEQETDEYGMPKETMAVSESGETTRNYDPTGAATYVKSRTLDYTFESFSSVSYLMNYTDTEADVCDTVESLYNSAYAAAKRSFDSSVMRAKENVSDFVNFKYLIIDRTSEAVYTNQNVKTPEEFLALFSEADCCMGYTAENGVVYATDSVTSDMLYTFKSPNLQYDPLAGYLNTEFADKNYDVYIGVPLELTGTDSFSQAKEQFEANTARVERLFITAVTLLILAFLLSVYLILVSGHVRDAEGIQLSVIDRIPTDLHLVLSGGLCVLGTALAFELLDTYVVDDAATYYIRTVSLLCLGVSAIMAAVYALLMEWINSVAKYGKAHKPYFKSMLIYRVGVLLFKIIGKGFALLRSGTKKIKGALFYKFKHMTKKTCLFVLCYVAVNAVLSILIATDAAFFAMVGLFGFNLVVLILVWKHLTALDKIMDAAEKSKTGEMPQDIGASIMPEPLRSLAKNLTFTQEEMQKAVSEAVKGERMKTELITNVSHDLKTPLTSIISYVDLLKKCDIDDIDAQKYITVLDEKSIRLKRLIEDLVEASKASSGAVTLNKMQVNLYELAVQAIGEMEDSFTAQDLQIVLNEPSEAPVVFVDSQKTWRVIDNLLNNARKYSLGGSRVYVDVAKQGDCGTFVVKNISGEALNIDPDELTQRFVRGDSSRTREGSGLGLSIAKDLCTLQGGALKIEIDGDLFKATVSLPLANGTFPINKPAQQ